MLKNLKHIHIIVYTFIAIIWGIIHFDLITQDPILGRDDLSILKNIMNTHSISEYFQKLMKGDYWDLQPVRDLTLFINKFFKIHFGFGGLHLFNLILALMVLVKLRTFLLMKKVAPLETLTIIALIALHPLYHVIFAWITNRKHLLSFFFILCYLIHWEKKGKLNFKTSLYMMLSLLSQPITLFIPILATGYDIFQQKKLRFLAFFDFILITIIMGANYLFYKNIDLFAARNLMKGNFWDFSWVVNISRAFSQIFIPISFAVEYDLGHPLALIGLILGVLFFILIYKNLHRDFKLYCLILMAFSTMFPIPVYNLRDAYLLGFLILVVTLSVIFLGLYLKEKKILILFFLLPFLGFQSYKFVDMWESDEKLTFQSYFIEGGAFNQTNLGYLYRKINPDFAYNLSLDLRERYPGGASYHLFLLVAESYYYTKLKTTEEKLKTYLQSEGQGLFHLFFKYKFLKTHNHLTQAQQTLNLLRQELSLHPEEIPVLKSMVCVNYPEDCQEINILSLL
jgi:hypothetical protein